jgi:hypothetical protein
MLECGDREEQRGSKEVKGSKEAKGSVLDIEM